jgi:hypothetical protein
MRSISLRVVVTLAFCLTVALADLYLHNFRGSNNRLNEQNAERNNGNRLFDSQNNNRGGYNVGDKTTQAATTSNSGNPDTTFDETAVQANSLAQQYQMVFYEQSILQVEWTQQHGCGGNELTDPNILNCNMVLQYACDSDNTLQSFSVDTAMQVALRDGTTTNQVNTDGSDASRGMHENAQNYLECTRRQRNQGLFTADRNLNGNTAQFTRQNNDGTRSGLECPEERDYYPYWLPTIWRDIAYLTDHKELCPFIQANSQNNNLKYKCLDPGANANILSKTNVNSCSDAGGSWVGYTWNLAAPVCTDAPWSRNNHLGNADRTAQMAHYNWTLPTFTSLKNAGARTYGANNDYVLCAFRIRYNISTDDYDPWNINASSNGNNSPVRNNPTVDVGADLQGLKLAMNTNQFGRTFQDRSHVFYIRQRPAYLSGKTVWNLNVRGKRGNIVQTYPAMEYDFVPNRLHVKSQTDFIHLQWTGSNTHDNNPDGEAGDGQGGDAGEGTDGTDRTNFVAIADLSDNYPIPLDKFPTTNIFANANCWKLDGTAIGIANSPNVATPNTDCAVWLATSGFFRQASSVTGFATNADANQGNNNQGRVTLDTFPPSLVGGVVMRVNTVGVYNYIGSRNNNFSNRSQKGTLVVDPATTSA